MRLIQLLSVTLFLGVGASCASSAATDCVAVTAAGSETTTATLAEVRTERSGSRSIRTAEGVQVRSSSDGEIEITGVDGRKIVVAADGTVRSAQRDVLQVRADGSRQVWDLVSQAFVSESTWTEQRAGVAGGGSSARTGAVVEAATEAEREEEQEGSGAKAVICHVPPGNPGNQHTLSVGESAVSAHLKHGDYEGDCDPRRATEKEHGNGGGNGKKKK